MLVFASFLIVSISICLRLSCCLRADIFPSSDIFVSRLLYSKKQKRDSYLLRFCYFNIPQISSLFFARLKNSTFDALSIHGGFSAYVVGVITLMLLFSSCLVWSPCYFSNIKCYGPYIRLHNTFPSQQIAYSAQL